MTGAAMLDSAVHPPAPAPARLPTASPESAAGANVPAEGAEPGLHLHLLRVPLPERALEVRDWRIGAGHKVAVIGPNGVGKTSLTEAVLGLRKGAEVDGSMLGVDLAQWRRRPALRKRLGVQLQRVFFPGRPRVKELVALHRSLYDRCGDHVIDALGIDALSHRLYEYLSRGETQRVDLFLALAHEPEMLFLDEPFTGLDPQFARRLAALLSGMQRTTLVMSCHTVEELSLVSHVAWLGRGGIRRCAAPDALRRELVGEYRLRVHCTDDATATLLARDLRQRAPAPCVAHVENDHLSMASDQPLAELARSIVGHPAVRGVDVGLASLGDLLRHCARTP